MKSFLSVLIFLSLLTSCNNSAFFPVEVKSGASSDESPDRFAKDTPGENDNSQGTEDAFQTDSFIKENDDKGQVDIVWVIDNSGSMANEQEAIATNFDAFIQDFVHEEIDFKMSIVTTDARAEYNGKPVEGSIEKLNYASYLNDSGEFFANFEDMIQVGIRGSGHEQGILTSSKFLNDYGKDYLRKEAHLAIVYVSDEEDQSSGDVSNYVEYFKSLKNRADKLQVSAIVRNENLEHVGNKGYANGGERYIEASNLTGGLYEEITGDFSQILSKMGERIVKKVQSFSLSKAPLDASEIIVSIDGVIADQSHWSYDSTINSIKFNENHMPQVGQEITVKYKLK